MSTTVLAGDATARRRKLTGKAPWQHDEPWSVRIGKWLILGLFALVIIIPLWMVVATSLASTKAVGEAGGMVLWTSDTSLNAYKTILSSSRIPRALGISLVATVLGTILSSAMTILCAYGLSRPSTIGHKFILWTVLFTYLFGPGLIPVYLVVRNIGIYNTIWALFVPNLFAAFNLIVLRSFFMGLPTELTDSARLDGASEWGILRKVILPLSKAPIAVISLFYGVGFWNNFFNAMLYLDDSNNYPLQMVLRDYVLNGSNMLNKASGSEVIVHNAPQTSIQMAVVVVAMVPVMLVYPFVQKHFVQGVIIGAVKG